MGDVCAADDVDDTFAGDDEDVCGDIVYGMFAGDVVCGMFAGDVVCGMFAGDLVLSLIHI